VIESLRLFPAKNKKIKKHLFYSVYTIKVKWMEGGGREHKDDD
jgi:hypothetical protein